MADIRKILIDRLINTEELRKNPPVLIDIGSSGQINKKWELIAKNSICLAFDADDREMNYIVNEKKGWKKLITYNKIVTDKKMANSKFYLTKFPFSSSLLEPDLQGLSNWIFSDLFTVEKTVMLDCIDLETVVKEQGLNYVDWFKIDSQGTDFRIFNSIRE